MPLWWLQLLLVAAWLFLAFARAGFWREFLKRNQPPELTGAPSVVAVVPARNEAATVAEAIGSLAAQNYPGEFRIVLCDDGSTDGTARLAKGAEIVTSRPLPAGWTGKLWAMREALRVAEVNKPDYYLFTDADITHGPANLQSLVARAQQGYDLVSYMATLNCRTPAEQLLIPAFVYFFFLLYPPALVRNPRSSAAGAAGGCILVRREALDRAGGLEAIRGELIDDCALAKAVKRAGGRVYLSLSPETRSIRQYDTAAEIERMIARTAFTQLHYSFIALIGCTLGLMFAFLLPLALPPGGTIAWAILTLTYIPALRFYNVPAWQAPLLPFVALYYLKATWHSAILYHRGEGGAWKGRVLPAGDSGRR